MPDQIIVKLDPDTTDVVGVDADRADTRLTVLSLLEAAEWLLSHELESMSTDDIVELKTTMEDIGWSYHAFVGTQ